jgi:hypothetical protein
MNLGCSWKGINETLKVFIFSMQNIPVWVCSEVGHSPWTCCAFAYHVVWSPLVFISCVYKQRASSRTTITSICCMVRENGGQDCTGPGKFKPCKHTVGSNNGVWPWGCPWTCLNLELCLCCLLAAYIEVQASAWFSCVHLSHLVLDMPTCWPVAIELASTHQSTCSFPRPTSFFLPVPFWVAF